MRVRFASLFSLLGALFCTAALAGALPSCWEQIGDSVPAVIYIVLTGALAFLLTRRPRRAGHFTQILCLLALTLRLAWALSAPPPTVEDDYGFYREVSLDCLQGDWAGLIRTIFPWGYFLYLYGLAWAFGPSPVVPVIVNAILGTAITQLICVIALRLLDERSARLAAVIYALWPGVIYWTGVFCAEIPHLFFFVAALAALLSGLDARKLRGLRLAAGGVLAAIAEFIRPVSPLLLLPLVVYALAMRKRVRRLLVPALGGYIACLALLLTAKSVASGHAVFTASDTLGINLSSGLNWESRGQFSLEDARVWNVEDPREASRRGLQLAVQHLKSMTGTNWWQMPVLAVVKFRRIWSFESCGYDANYIGLTGDQAEQHWLARYGGELLAGGQLFHSLALALAAIGFLRTRRTGQLALPGCILVAFALLHTAIEVDDRYHFAAQSLLAIAAAGAFLRMRMSSAPTGEVEIGADPSSVIPEQSFTYRRR